MFGISLSNVRLLQANLMSVSLLLTPVCEKSFQVLEKCNKLYKLFMGIDTFSISYEM